ncbi:hypothetical protein EPO44_01790 [bacterium]|nr:MAG: hypothetical protein EPO44_01790 [bacterium]
MIALGFDLFQIKLRGEKLDILVISCRCRAAAFAPANLLDLPLLTAGAIVPFAAMPTAAKARVFAVQYQRPMSPWRTRWCWWR